MAEKLILAAADVPNSILKKPAFTSMSIKSIESPWEGFNKYFGIVEIDGKQLYYFKSPDKDMYEREVIDYFETYLYIPKDFYMVDTDNWNNITLIGDLPQNHLLPLYVENTYKISDTNSCKEIIPPPPPIGYIPNLGDSTCVMAMKRHDGKIPVLFSRQIPDLPSAGYSDYPEYPVDAGGNSITDMYYIPTLMPNLAICFIATTSIEFAKGWIEYLQTIETAFCGAIDNCVIPVDDWKCFIAFDNTAPEAHQYLPPFEVRDIGTKAYNFRIAKRGGIRFIENPNVKR